MKLCCLLFVLFITPLLSFAQFPVSPNKLDANGKRTGHWTLLYDSAFKKELKDPDSVRYYRLLKYEAGKPVGKVRDFYRTGRKQWEANVISINPDIADGEAISYHENGKVKYKSYYTKGKAEGVYDEYSVNGKLLIHGTMKEDSAVGKWNYYKEDGFRWAELEKLGNQKDFWITYYPTGQIQKKGLIVKDLMEGLWLGYYENGHFNSKSFYKNGLLNGPWEWYNTEGILEETGTYLNDNKFGNWTIYYNGAKALLKKGTYDSAGKETGYWIYYHANGNKKSEGEMRNGGNHGNWRFYYEDGSLKTEGLLLKGFYEGEIKTYHSSGKLESVAMYERDTIHGAYVGYYENGNVQAKGEKAHGHKIGLWIYNFQSGLTDGTEEFSMGVLNGKTVNYHTDGTVKDETIYSNGKRDGLFTSYYSNKNVAVKGLYKMEKRTGEWSWYFDNGQLDEKFIYKEGLSEGIYFKHHRNGIKRAEGAVLHGKLTGETKYYFANGQLKSEGNNIEGKGEGVWTFYDSLTGKKISQGLLVKDKYQGRWNFWTPEGKKKQPKYYFMDWREEPYNIRDSIISLSDRGQYDKAWAAVSWEKKVIKREYPIEHLSYALPPYLYGYILLYGKKQAQQSIPYFEEYGKLTEKYEGQQSANYFAALNNLANAYSAIGQRDKALAMHDNLLALTRKDSIRAKYNTYLFNKAGTLYDLGKKKEAENLFMEEISFQKSQDNNYTNVWDIQQKHGEFFFSYAYDYEKAIPIFKELYTGIYNKEQKNKRLLYCAQKAAYSNHSLARRAQTIAWLKVATRHAEELNIPNFNDYFGDLGSLANNYIGVNFLDSANQVYDKMNGALVERNLLNTVAHSSLLDGQAEVYYKNYQNEEALAHWTQAKEILEGIGKTKVDLYADVLQAMAMAYSWIEKYAEAENIYKQSLQISKELNGLASKTYLQSSIGLAGVYEDMSAYDKGEALLNEVLKTIGETPAAYNLSNQANAMIGLADIKGSLGKYNEAIQYDQKALVYFEENRSNDPLTLASILSDISTNYRRLGNYENAEKYLLKAIGVVEEFFGKEGATYLSYQSSLAHYYNSRELYGDAVKIFQSVLNGYEKLSGKNSSRYVQALRNLASCYFDQGEYQKAEPLYRQARDLALAVEGAFAYDYSDALYKLADINFNLGKNTVSEKFYLQYTAIEKQKYGVKHPDYALALKELATFYFNINRLSEAEPLMTEAVTIMGESAYGKNSKLYARYILSLAKILSARNKNKEAEELLLQAVAITGANKTDFYYDYISTVEGLADFYEKLGQYNNVEKLRKEVISLTETRTGKDFNYAAKNLKLLALYYGAGKYENAISLGNELLGYFENELARDHYLILEIHNLMGLTELKFRNFEAAASHFNYCIEMRDLNGTQKSFDYATYLNNLSLTTVAKGDFVATENLLNKAAAIRTELGIKLNPRAYALITDNYAGLYQAWGKLDKAERYWLDVIQKLLGYTQENFYFMSDEEKSQFWNDTKEDFEYFNTFAVLRAQQNPAILGEMYNNQLATKAILLSASNKIKKRILSSGDTVMVNNYYHWVETRERLAQLYTSSDSELKNKKPQVDSLALLAKRIEKELNISSEDLTQDKGAQNKMTSWKEVQRALAPNEAAIEIIRFRHFDRYLRDSVIYAALVLTAETKLNPQLVVLPNGKLLEGRAMKYYKNAITAKIEDKFSYKYFWASIEPLVKNKTRIYLSLDGVYNQINLNTLADADGNFLVESKNLTILSNTKDLLLLKGKRTTRYAATTASLFGYPKYFIGKDRMKEKITKQKRDFDFATLDERDATGIAELPGTQTEIAEVKNVLTSHQWQTNDYLDEGASEKALKSVDYPAVLHIATHGFFVDDQETSATFKVGAATEYAKQNPLLRSGLLLSGAANFIQNNVRLEEENGILTAYEAANLNLDNTELVVLSACETGKGEVQNGEGVYGLQRAFQTAGAQAIIMSLWKVDDQATQELMSAFYQNWMSGTPKAEAFRQAQLQLKKKYTNPYYWGAFVMMGN
jgi:antitoxin component YwqK of YwqJK toxin-antitoxin module/CHAT domain-containing protein/tetratricopeptide (TPR) repeat protein